MNKQKKELGIVLITIAILLLVFAIIINTYSIDRKASYGGDAYTDIQNAIVDLSKIVRDGIAMLFYAMATISAGFGGFLLKKSKEIPMPEKSN